MNTKKPNEIINKHQSEFAMMCLFEPGSYYREMHQKWTFRGDSFTGNVETQIQYLKKNFYQLRQVYRISKAVIYDNRPQTIVPGRVVCSWFRGKLEISNEALVSYSPQQFQFSMDSLQWLAKHGLVSIEY